MMIEFWEHISGYDKWTPIVATVQSSVLASAGFGDVSKCKIVWEDQHCMHYTAEFKAFEESPLYQLCDGDTVEMRFNPKSPTEFYIRGLLESDLVYAWKSGVYGVMIILVVLIVFVAWFGPSVINVFSH